MKQRSIGLWQLMGFAVTSLGGTLLHFLYDWTGGLKLVAPISGVNESTWEHMKLLFFPMLLFAVVQSFFFRDVKEFWCIKLRGILLGIILIPVLFYTYNGVIGRSPDFINISIFFISDAIAYVFETKKFKSKKIRCGYPKAAFIILCAVGVLFIVFTFVTPKICIFKDPLTQAYGIKKV
jgi:hypothetical protein